MIEYSITVKDEERTLTKRELSYETELLLSKESPILLDQVRAIVKEFGSDPEKESPDIVVKAKLIW